MMPDIDEPDPDMTAGELALGVLRGEEQAAALRRMLADRAFAGEVDRWQARLAPLIDTIPEQQPPDTAWPAIERQIAPPAGASGGWRAAALVSSAMAACLAVLLVARPVPAPVLPPPTPEPVALLAQLPGDAGAPLVTLRVDAANERLRVRTANLPAGERVPELWVIGDDATPVSLGLVAKNGASVHALPRDLVRRLVDGATIAVTLEPNDGRAHAAPSMTPLATARLTAV